MWIEEMPRQACTQFLAKVRLGRLACAKAGQPYVTPLFFAYHADALYSVSTVGQKIHWMRENPLACVEVDEVVNPQLWTSVVMLGRYEELPDRGDHGVDRKLAYELLQSRKIWWEPAYARTIVHGTERALELVYFRIHIDSMSGHQATQ